MKFYCLLFGALLLGKVLYAQVDTTQRINPNTRNSIEQQKKPYLIMISLDGFRYDYAQKYHAAHLLALSANGVRAEAMIPSYPSLTFPNHYTLVTGLYPSHHGIIQNHFYSPDFNAEYYYKGKTNAEGRWYGGTPIWVLAEQHKMISAVDYWVGSEAMIKNTRPTYYYAYNDKTDAHTRIETVVNWLKLPADRRPHLINFYMPEVDYYGHHFGPGSTKSINAIHFVDSVIYQLTKAVKATGLDVNYIVVSDHGMTSIDTVSVAATPQLVTDTSRFRVFDDGEVMNLYVKNKADVKAAYDTLKMEAKDYHVYLRDQMPANLHYNTKDDRYNHIADLILVPTWPKRFNTSHKRLDPAEHGYDPYKVKDMQAIFYAWGPNFKKGITIPPFQNIDVFPMVAQLLGLNYTDKIDGTKELADKVLVKKR